MAIQPSLKDTQNYQMISGLDQVGEAQELTFIGDEVKVVLDRATDSTTNSIQTITYEHHEIHSNSHYFLEGYIALASAEVLDFCVTTDSGAAWPHVVFSFDSVLELTFQLFECADFDPDGTLAVQFGNNRAKCFCGSHTAVASSATIMTDSTASFIVDALIGWKIYNITDGSYGIITDNDATTITVAALVRGTDNDWDTDDTYEINRSLIEITTGATINSTGVQIGGSKGGSGTNPANGVPGGASRSNEIVLRPSEKYIWRFTSGANGNSLSYNAEWYEHTDK